MILIGISPSVSLKSAALAVLEKRLVRMRRQYDLFDVIQVTLGDLETECIRLARGPSLCRRKRLYSQDRRPRKTVPSRPRLVFDMTETGTGPVTALRAQAICVDGVRIVEDGSWQKDPFGRALGDNYRVPETDLFRTLVRILDHERLIMPEDPKGADGLSEAIEQVRKEPRLGIPSPDFRAAACLRALALPLWFRETVPYRRAYRAT